MGGSGWTVTSQVTDQTLLTDAGQVIIGVNVYFVTGNGNRGYVFVPNDHYHNTRKVAELIRAQANQMDAIGDLAENMNQG